VTPREPLAAPRAGKQISDSPRRATILRGDDGENFANYLLRPPIRSFLDRMKFVESRS
jgi:hypothetical protein